MKKLLMIAVTVMMIIPNFMSEAMASTPYQIYFGNDHIFSYNQKVKKIGATTFTTSNDVVIYKYKGHKKKKLAALSNSHIVSNGTYAFYLKKTSSQANSEDWAFPYNVMRINLKTGKSTKIQTGVCSSTSALYGYMNGKLLIANESMESYADEYQLINVSKKKKAGTYGSSTFDRQYILDQYGNTYIAKKNIDSSTINCYKFSGKKGKKRFTVTTKAYKNRVAIDGGYIYYFETTGSKVALKRVSLNGKHRKTVKKIKSGFSLCYFSHNYAVIKRSGKASRVYY